MCIVVWNVNDNFVWYVRYAKEQKNEDFVVNHLEWEMGICFGSTQTLMIQMVSTLTR